LLITTEVQADHGKIISNVLKFLRTNSEMV